MSTLHARLEAQLAIATASLRTNLPDIDARIAAFLTPFQVPPLHSGFKHTAPEARAAYEAALAAAGETGARTFLAACLFAAVLASLRGERLASLPARVKAHQLRQFDRIAAHDAGFLTHCHLDGDVYLKELGLATLRLYAGASSVIDPHSGLGRSLLWKGGLRQLPARGLFFARTGGFKPYFEVHVHKLYLDEFHEEGRNECYRCCVELYGLHPQALGMIGGSWFYDPAIASFSPHLAYLRNVPVAGGARSLFASHDEQAMANATATSQTRRGLVASGAYRPASYTLVWPRRAQIAWAQRHHDEARKP